MHTSQVDLAHCTYHTHEAGCTTKVKPERAGPTTRLVANRHLHSLCLDAVHGVMQGHVQRIVDCGTSRAGSEAHRCTGVVTKRVKVSRKQNWHSLIHRAEIQLDGHGGIVFTGTYTLAFGGMAANVSGPGIPACDRGARDVKPAVQLHRLLGLGVCDWRRLEAIGGVSHGREGAPH